MATENVMILGSCIELGDADLLFEGEPFAVLEARDLPDLLVKCGIYSSASEARRAGRQGPIPPGWTEMKASKKVPRFCIWNPTKWTRDYPDDD